MRARVRERSGPSRRETRGSGPRMIGDRTDGSAGAIDDLSMGGAELSNSAHHAQTMSANDTLHDHHKPQKPAKRSAANQSRQPA